MNTPEAEAQVQEPPVTPEERKFYERIISGLNQLYRRRRKRDPVSGKTWDEPPFTAEEVDKIYNAIEHIAKRLKMEHCLEEAYKEWRDRIFWKTVITPAKREPVKPLPLP